MKPKKKIEPQVTEEVETEVTLKPKKKPGVVEQEDVEQQITLPKKKRKPQVVEEAAAEVTIKKEVGMRFDTCMICLNCILLLVTPVAILA